MSWSDKIEESIIYSFGKDPPEQRKKEIKEKIRQELSKNPILSDTLKQNKAEGKFIKEFTKQLMECRCSPKDLDNRITYAINHSSAPIDNAICWRLTNQGHNYWSTLNSIVSTNLIKARKTRF